MKYLIVLPFLFLGACADKDSNSQLGAVSLEQNTTGIVGGRLVKANDPVATRVVMIEIKYENGGTNLCTGTPIDKTTILTAAHCVKGAVRVRVGYALDEDSITKGNLVVAKSFKAHEDYEEDADQYDLGLVRLQKAIPSNYKVSKIYDGSQEVTSDTVTLVGYGITSSQGTDAGYLRTTTKDLDDVRIRNNSILIIQQPHNGVCSGDSGGPVFVQVGNEMQLIGVNSYVEGPSKNPCGQIAGSVYVKSQLTWIRKTIKEL
ncbi:trypsin-like serine protease [Bdellovibrio sp. KM01]|uniref:S1 family peptidase n=1 Tax=Bdellovibrio sp. KM01 TaxID=2748865 RepID=UPI0015EA7BDD|nr:trypsin-like serine protease [Bdellovibrio sp. KM01]QLY24001.1 trypsin-like serine protease [Bdellovibrio sp. KM01]